MRHSALTADHRSDLQTAIWLTYVTIAWMIVEGAFSLLLGSKSGSLILTTFGIDSVIELSSAAVLLWRLRIEAIRDTSQQSIRNVELRASQLAGFALLTLAIYVAANSAVGLIRHRVANSHENVWGIGIGVVAAVGMPLLAKSKLKVASPDRLNSRALRADAMEALTCGYLSWVMIGGLAINYALGWWWLDNIAALALLPLIVKEGLEAVRGEACSSCHAARD